MPKPSAASKRSFSLSKPRERAKPMATVPGSSPQVDTHAPDPAYAVAQAAQLRARRKRCRPPPNTPGRPKEEPRRSPTQHAGKVAEDRALVFLQKAGLQLLARNVSCRQGEIDLVMQHGAVLVFVEVRARSRNSHGGAAASVSVYKQARIISAARYFLHTQWRGPLPTCRFDVLAFEQAQDVPCWIPSAFDAV